MHGVRLESVRKTYGSLVIIDKLDLQIEDGEFLVLLGPSGCGKSTLLNMIAGLEPVTEGRIWMGGRDVTGLEPDERDIAMVFQSYALYPNMTVRKNIGFGLKMRKVPDAEIDRKVDTAARLLRIEHLLDRRPANLSGGQQQRVAIGRALVREPSVFLFDEPLSNLDAKLRADMRVELKKLHERLGRTMVYVTHDQIEAMTMATRIVVLEQGRVQQCDKPEVIYDRPANRFVASFVGAPTMNFLDGRLTRNGDGLALACRDAVIPLPGLEGPSGLAEGRPIVLGLRPEHVLTAEAGGAGTIQAVPLMSEPTGPDMFVRMALGGSEITARMSSGEKVERNAPLPIRIDGRRVSLFSPDDGARLA
ncbi:sn-glycerol-3-phosphate ABC transporter ATP-binding protein UgpC [Archangium violaceum]|uniref:ABC transporter ATP-binding protein n=1 Tax=Archangium violaceum TaxID=83451 RepID=UPI001952603F|nr:sn-glycerol-3-phosphate ABC transporter ATP-binding protein UgpC [Archangium violaceum]QRN93447.1 sn-glycerol-3-phosphate ABC transporter ATP-binding protein UgpC [Archangium violaceum]